MTSASRYPDPTVSALPWPYGVRPEPDSDGGGVAGRATLSPSPNNRKVKSILSSASHRARPVQGADVAQAGLFDGILQSEIAELEQLAESAERRWLSRRERGIGEDKLPEALVRLGERVAETRRLLDNLRDRFPHE